jgi:hypothetical protein
MPLYISKGALYNVWFTGVSILQHQDKTSFARLTNHVHCKAQMFVKARQRNCSATTATWLHDYEDRVNPCPRIDARIRFRPGGKILSHFTGFHAID